MSSARQRTGRAVGPAGVIPPGQPASRTSWRRRPILFWVVSAVVAASLSALAATLQPTQALMTATADPQVNTVTAGTWGPQIPPQCAGMTFKHVLLVPPGGAPFVGTNQSDLIIGTSGPDIINGGNGDDCIVGGPGDDQITGGNGSDVLIGGSGNDTLNGDNAPDRALYGGDGDDIINGDNGPDVVDGGNGDDTCNGGRAPSQLLSCEHTS